MNSIVSAASVATATAIPSIDHAVRAPDVSSPSAALARAEQAITTLRSFYVSDSWKIDENDAEQALAGMRCYATGKADDDQEAAMVEFFGSHGQSLDWIFRGDVTGMICTLAARSSRAATVADDPIFPAMEAHRAARQAYERACEKHSRAEESYPEKVRPEARIKVGERPETEISTQPNNRGGYTIESYPSGKLIPIYAKTWRDIDEHAPAELNEDDRSAWIEARREELDAEDEHLFAEWQKTELGKLDTAMANAFDIEDRRTRDLVWTTPTTAQGLAALLSYCRKIGGFQEVARAAEWGIALEWAIECAACSLAGLPKLAMTKQIKELWKIKQREDHETSIVVA